VAVQTLSYAIDEQDHVIRVDDGFYRFAEENGWDGAGASLGRSLWDFVAGEGVRRLQRLLLRRIREGVRGGELPFRCDGPEVRREMDIRINSDRTGRIVLFSTRLRAASPRPTRQPVFDPSVPREDGFLQICTWCDRFLVDGEWVEVEVAAKRLQLFLRSEMPQLDHDICPRCSGTLLAA